MARKRKERASRKKGKAGKATASKGGARTKATRKADVDLGDLRRTAEEAQASLEAAHKEAGELTGKAKAIVTEAKEAFSQAVAPYRIACRKAGQTCEFTGGRSSNVSPKVSFEVEKTKKGIRVMVKAQPKTEEVIPFATLKESVNKAAYAYTDKHVGSREEVGNKGGSLSNRLRAAMA